MAIFGICLGTFVFMFVGAFVGGFLKAKEAGVLPGLVAGIWAAWPCIHHAQVARYDFLHPAPLEYNVAAKVAFTRVRDLLAEVSYNFGDKWQISTADTQTGRLMANLRFTDEETHFDFDARGHVQTRKERMQRFIVLEAIIKDTGKGTTIIQFDFLPKVEGAKFSACDSIVSEVWTTVDSALGHGAPVGEPADSSVPAPPWWLLGLSAVTALAMAGDVCKAVFR